MKRGTWYPPTGNALAPHRARNADQPPEDPVRWLPIVAARADPFRAPATPRFYNVETKGSDLAHGIARRARRGFLSASLALSSIP